MRLLKAVRHIKRINHRHYLCIALTLAFLLCSVFVFPDALGRVIESCRDFGLSAAFYFCELFSIPHTITPTVNNLPEIPFFPSPSPAPDPPPSGDGSGLPAVPIPDTFDEFKAQWSAYWRLWASKENFVAYLAGIGNVAFVFCQILLCVIPLIAVCMLLWRRYMNTVNNDYDKDSKPLQRFKRLSAAVFLPAKAWLLSVLAFIREHRYYGVLWLCIWLFNFNLFTIAAEFLAFYLYFVASFDVVNIYRQVYKLFLDLWPMLTFVPVWVWVLAALVLFDRFRKRVGYAALAHYENRNRGFINARPIVFMVCGTMGKKKTTAITDMALSQEAMFRDKARDKLLETDMKFPHFPWITLENELNRAVQYHQVYNLATVRRWVRKKALRWSYFREPAKIFGYDFERYGLVYDDKLKLTGLWDVLETYAQLYFIYVLPSSLMLSNYSIRTDALQADAGNFPLWDTDFFHRDSRLTDRLSRHAHIIDFDALRLGRKVRENNPHADSFDFGVVMVTEIGKERKNTLELREVKKKEDGTNQKNDGFNDWLKLARHSSTVDNFPFVRVIADEQRPESWGADARDLAEIVHIRDSSDTRLAMPFFWLEEFLYGWLFPRFSRLYTKYRYTRGDNTLLMYIVKKAAAALYRYYARIYNRFGYCVLHVQVERGTQDGDLADAKYYLMHKKIYSKRFSTDCFSDYFAQKTLASPVGLDDLPEYRSEKASIAELKAQQSYFIDEISSKTYTSQNTGSNKPGGSHE